MLSALPFRAEAVIVDRECRVHMTPGTETRLRLNVELQNQLLPECVP